MFVDEGLLVELDNAIMGYDTQLKVGLYTDTITIDNATVIGDLTGATYPGYARFDLDTVTWPAASIAGDGSATVNGPLLSFPYSGGPGGGETITGIYVTIKNHAGTEFLWFAENFATPVVITGTGDSVDKKLNFKKRNY